MARQQEVRCSDGSAFQRLASLKAARLGALLLVARVLRSEQAAIKDDEADSQFSLAMSKVGGEALAGRKEEEEGCDDAVMRTALEDQR